MAMILAVGGLVTAAPAGAARVGVITEPQGAPLFDKRAVGLLVAGRGPTVSRDEALAALEGVPLGLCRCEFTILVRLPPAEHANDRRYAITIAGPGYEGMLVSDRTRVPGLVSIYDVKPTVEALRDGRTPPVTSRARADVQSRLAALDTRLDDVGHSRTAASLALVAVVAALALLALLRRSPLLGRAALLAAPAMLAAALALSVLEVSRPRDAVALLLVAGVAGGLGGAVVTQHRYALAGALLTIFVVYLVVLGVSTETSSLAVLGPRPENGGRFYGFNNQLETLLLVPGLLGAALLPSRFLLPASFFVLVTVGASFAGADGGGVLVFGAAFLFLWMRLRDVPLTARNLALAGAAVVAIGVALVGLDAALGGESHVTRSVGEGPVQVLRDIGERIAASAEGVVSSWHSALVVGFAIPVLVWLGLRRPSDAVLDALLVALAVSLLVNDAPREVAGFGAVSAGALRFWRESSESVE